LLVEDEIEDLLGDLDIRDGCLVGLGQSILEAQDHLIHAGQDLVGTVGGEFAAVEGRVDLTEVDGTCDHHGRGFLIPPDRLGGHLLGSLAVLDLLVAPDVFELVVRGVFPLAGTQVERGQVDEDGAAKRFEALQQGYQGVRREGAVGLVVDEQLCLGNAAAIGLFLGDQGIQTRNQSISRVSQACFDGGGHGGFGGLRGEVGILVLGALALAAEGFLPSGEELLGLVHHLVHRAVEGLGLSQQRMQWLGCWHASSVKNGLTLLVLPNGSGHYSYTGIFTHKSLPQTIQ